MESNLPVHDRLTAIEKVVVEWVFNLTRSIVGVDYNLPTPMTYAINNLSNAVCDLAKERGISIYDV